MTELLTLTGPPRLRPAPGGVGTGAWLALPRATFSGGVDVRRRSRSRWKEMWDRSQKRVGPAVWDRTLRWAHEVLDPDVAAALVAVLETELVEVEPRTRAAGDPDLPVARFVCRVTSEVPDTAHLSLGYSVEVELDVLTAGTVGGPDEV